MRNIRLLTIDIDGTLVSDKFIISQANQEALHKAEEAGIILALASGRPFESCMKLVNKLKLKSKYHIISDGAWCGDKEGNELFCQPIHNLLIEQIVDFARRIGLHIELYTLHHGYAEIKNWSDYVHVNYLGVHIKYQPFDEFWQKDSILKIGLLSKDDDEMALISQMEERFGHLLNFSCASAPCAPDVHFINIVHQDVNKGIALKKLSAYYGLTTAQIAAIGDGINDIPLLEAAGLAVAMENAKAALKEKAHMVTGHVGADGVAEFINDYLL
ncbi:MAG: Cof-type HAD-IIB family hydrolase [Chloroflexi bacterium]|nr:Cof-type HAD-IIB family hydrolase [Chloroflexota bacterium]